jgi:lysyl-tRNA synthetase class 2
VVDVAGFTLAGRAMRDMRKMVTRARKAGYDVRVRAVVDLADDERAALADLAARWRGAGPDRGYSMALGRAVSGEDPDAVVVTAARDGRVRGLLQFVPWGDDGLSLDLMRRDRDGADAGLNELMIADLLAACPLLGVRRVSLNFAMFRTALVRGQRIGAGPVDRAWARLLRLGSRWWQIESLYRFNAKFAPHWVPRYVAYPASRELPRIALAAVEAESFWRRPRLVRWSFPRGQQQGERRWTRPREPQAPAFALREPAGQREPDAVPVHDGPPDGPRGGPRVRRRGAGPERVEV